MNLPLTNITTPKRTVRVLLASSRFGDRCLSQLISQFELSPVMCQSRSKLLKSLQEEPIEILVIDVKFLQQQTQQFCWGVQNTYPTVKIILLGRNPSELECHNWVYEFPSISTAYVSSESEVKSSVVPTESAMLSNRKSEALEKSYLDSIIGAAIFDLNGLPREYLITKDIKNMSWVQTIFQALGLRSLLTSSLQLEGFDHVVIYNKEYYSVVVKQRYQYMALLIHRTSTLAIAPDFIEWAKCFEPSRLKTNPQFYVA